MEIVVTRKFAGKDEVLSTETYKLKESETILLASRKWEKKVPVKKWFRVVGHKLVMCSKTMLAIKPQSVNENGFAFTVLSEANIVPTGNITMVKNPKKGDVYILGVGENITFTTQDENPNEEYNITIKEIK